MQILPSNREEDATLTGCLPNPNEDATLQGCLSNRNADATLMGCLPKTRTKTVQKGQSLSTPLLNSTPSLPPNPYHPTPITFYRFDPDPVINWDMVTGIPQRSMYCQLVYGVYNNGENVYDPRIVAP